MGSIMCLCVCFHLSPFGLLLLHMAWVSYQLPDSKQSIAYNWSQLTFPAHPSCAVQASSHGLPGCLRLVFDIFPAGQRWFEFRLLRKDARGVLWLDEQPVSSTPPARMPQLLTCPSCALQRGCCRADSAPSF